jgi:catalase
LQGRVFSYLDTQNYRLGGPNFHELPINRPINGKHNNQKDGFSRIDILKGDVSYFPNSKTSGCPYHAMLKGEVGYQSHAQKIDAQKVRARSQSFADHFSQARLFFNSQSPEEQDHMINALSFELSKVKDVAVRRRQLAILNQIDARLAKSVGDNLGLTPPSELDELTLKFARQNHSEYPVAPAKLEVEKSKALSMKVDPGEASIATRKVAFLIDKGVRKASIDKMEQALKKEGAKAVLIAGNVGEIKTQEGETLMVQHSYLTEASVCYDAFYTPEGASVEALKHNPDYIQFLNEGFLHCKAIAFANGAESLMKQTFLKKDKGVIFESEDQLTEDFIHAMKGHRVWEREAARKVPA